jgi:hypothetical protein
MLAAKKRVVHQLHASAVPSAPIVKIGSAYGTAVVRRSTSSSAAHRP